MKWNTEVCNSGLDVLYEWSERYTRNSTLINNLGFTNHAVGSKWTLKSCKNGLKNTNVYSKTCLERPIKRRPKLFSKTDYCLMQVKSIAECSLWSVLQYFWPSLSYPLPLRPLFCLFVSGRLRQVLLYKKWQVNKGFRGQQHWKWI